MLLYVFKLPVLDCLVVWFCKLQIKTSHSKGTKTNQNKDKKNNNNNKKKINKKKKKKTKQKRMKWF